MRICKICGIEKPLNNYTSYRNYPTKFRHTCKECENKKARERGHNFRKELIQIKKEEDIIREFNSLKLAEYILDLLTEEYDISWNGEDTIIFTKAESLTVHIKNATKNIYDLIFARYCIEYEKRFTNNNLMKYNCKK